MKAPRFGTIPGWNLRCIGAVVSLVLGGCTAEPRPLGSDARPVLENYAAIVFANYNAAVDTAVSLQTAVDALVAAPSTATLNAARQAWLAAREPYGQTETFRFYDGPIDNPTDGPEGRINSWPLDEAYIDYVEGDAQTGIINDPATFPMLTTALLASRNEQGGEKNIATGYHAIEFLLWGQDRSASGPGDRPYTDYVSGAGGTAANQARRGQYLQLAAELLVDDLTAVRNAWQPGGGDYRSQFVALDAKEAVRRMIQGMGSLSGAELSGERLATAYDNRDQEDEHSCFSDNTHRDLYNNALAIQNVYLGRYGSIDGPGLDELVRSRDAALDARMQQQLAASIAAVQAIPVPFDQALNDEASRPKILTAIRALQTQTETTVEIARLLGVQINLE